MTPPQDFILKMYLNISSWVKYCCKKKKSLTTLNISQEFILKNTNVGFSTQWKSMQAESEVPECGKVFKNWCRAVNIIFTNCKDNCKIIVIYVHALHVCQNMYRTSLERHMRTSHQWVFSEENLGVWVNVRGTYLYIILQF